MADNQGGYEEDLFVEKVHDRYICNICTKPLRDPHLVACCGQHYCDSCLNQWFQKNTEKCPHCRAQGKEFQHVKDKKLKREILTLRVKCSIHEEECQWIGELESREDHLLGCGYVEVKCPNKCYRKSWPSRLNIVKKIKRKDLDKHLKEDCFNREFQCEHCGKRDKYIEITGVGSNFKNGEYHYKECKEMPIPCPNKCGVDKLKRKDHSSHYKVCPLERIKCPYKCKQIDPKGTKKKTELVRRDLNRHLKQCYLRPYKCGFCNLESTYKAITGYGLYKQPTNHYQTCPEFQIPCPNQCGTMGILRKEIASHRRQCPEETVQCPNKCQSLLKGMKRKQLSHHTTEECPLRPYSCQHCDMKDTYTAITKHYYTCKNYPLECPNKCGVTRKRKHMKSHLDKCPLQAVDCPFAEAGCKDKPVRQDLENHNSTMQQRHMLLIMGAFRLMKEDHEKTKQELKQTKKELEDVKTQYVKKQPTHQVSYFGELDISDSDDEL